MPPDSIRIDRLSELARLIKERDLAAMEGAAAARGAILSEIAALEREVTEAREAARRETADLSEARACARLAQFAAHRRAVLNVALAGAMANLLSARDAAARSTGRLDALEKLASADRNRLLALRRRGV